MRTVLLAGLGDVGIRAARQLLDTDGIDRLLVADRHLAHAQDAARALHDGAEPVELPTAGAFPPGVDVVANALPAGTGDALTRAAVDHGIAVASVDSQSQSSLAALDDAARAASTCAVVGCGLAPGLGDVLTRHAASALDTVDEAHIARFGAAGDACLAAARAAQHEPAVEWRDGRVVQEKGHRAELIWFPDPVGARECELVGTGIDELLAAVPNLDRASVRIGLPHVPRVRLPGALQLLVSGRADPGVGWGAVRAEVWGEKNGARATVIYGVIERTAVAAGTVVGVTAAWLAGALEGVGDVPTPGAVTLGASVATVPFLAELARRGVKAAAFEGVPVG